MEPTVATLMNNVYAFRVQALLSSVASILLALLAMELCKWIKIQIQAFKVAIMVAYNSIPSMLSIRMIVSGGCY
jgi:hypothetical protein